MADKTTKPLGATIRVSRVNGREGDSYLTPEIQTKKIRDTAKEKGLTVSTCRTDEDVSGAKAKPHADRGLGELLTLCERGELGGTPFDPEERKALIQKLREEAYSQQAQSVEAPLRR
jgi:hypothetical protein